MTLHKRLDNTFPIVKRIYESTRPPDECWLMCENEEDFDTASRARHMFHSESDCHVVHWPTPKNGKKYAIIPYSNKINYALDQTKADYIVYVDNGSMPHERKFELMAQALDENPDWAGVYCAQKRTGINDSTMPADQIVKDGFCALNYTQVMHRLTDHRWETDMKWGVPDMADAHFWRQINTDCGPFYPVAPELVLDEHHIPETHAEGMV